MKVKLTSKNYPYCTLDSAPVGAVFILEGERPTAHETYPVYIKTDYTSISSNGAVRAVELHTGKMRLFQNSRIIEVIKDPTFTGKVGVDDGI